MGKRVTVIRQNGEHVVQVKEFPVLSWESLKNILYVVGLLATVAAVFWSWQRSQDQDVRETTGTLNEKVEDNGRAIERIGQRQEDHLGHATKVFEEFSETMKEQRKVMGETREDLVKYTTMQEALKEDIRDLTVEMKKANGHTP